MQIYNSKTGKVVTDPRDEATYNFFNPDKHPVGHLFADVIPWVLFGNSGQDSTFAGQRIWYMIGMPGIYSK